MAWTAPMTAVDNAMYTAAQFNTHVRDNLLETMPGKATTPGSFFVSNSPNLIYERVPYTDTVIAAESVSVSSTFADLTTVGPSLTVDVGTAFFAFVSANMIGSVSGTFALMGLDLTGPENIPASDGGSLGSQGNTNRQMGHVFRYIVSSPGTYTLTAKYRCSTGTATFSNRSLSVVPI